MKYSLGEEIFNSVSHGIGAALSIAALIVMIVFSTINNASSLEIIGYIIYGVTLIVLYTFSTLYHAITNKKAKKILRIIDHSSVYLLISGSITPYTFSVLKNTGPKVWIIFSVVWVLTIVGTVLYSIFKDKIKVINIISYIIMGWSVILLFPELNLTFKSLNLLPCLYLLIAGGISYTIGVIFYAIKKIKYFHSIWHLFVLLGSILHFTTIMLYILK